MTDIKEAFGTNGQAVTITLASLAATSGRQGVSVDNRTNKFLDLLVQLKLKPNGTVANDKAAYLYAAGTVDDGTTWPDAIAQSSGDATDAAITLDSPTQLRLVGTLYLPTNSVQKISEVWSIARVFDGILPAKIAFVVVNSSVALTATGSDHSLVNQGAYATNL